MKYLLLLLLSFNVSAVTLTGTPPTQREDNTPFNLDTELQGFNVYCGTRTGDYVDTYPFTGYTLPVTEWVVQLAPGTHYCVVTTIDTDLRESVYSSEVVVNVNGKYRPNAPNVTDTIINIVITLPQN